MKTVIDVQLHPINAHIPFQVHVCVMQYPHVENDGDILPTFLRY